LVEQKPQYCKYKSHLIYTASLQTVPKSKTINYNLMAPKIEKLIHFVYDGSDNEDINVSN